MNDFNAVFSDPESEQNVAWSANMFRILREGGNWGVPRSGLIFQKQGSKLVCTLRMPHVPEMPMSAEQLMRQQDADVDCIRRSFGAAGIIVEDRSIPGEKPSS